MGSEVSIPEDVVPKAARIIDYPDVKVTIKTGKFKCTGPKHSMIAWYKTTIVQGALIVTSDAVYVAVQTMDQGFQWVGPHLKLKFEDPLYQKIEIRPGTNDPNRLVFSFNAEDIEPEYMKGDVKYCLHLDNVQQILELLPKRKA